MNDEIMLKQKYNYLLNSLKKGEEYVKANPDNEDYKKRLEEIGNEIQNIMKMFPKMTAEEMENGFDIEQNVIEKKSIKSIEIIGHNQRKVKQDNLISTTTGNIELTPEIVKQYLVNGQGNVTNQEVMMFIGMCKANHLNPFNKDAYLIKYGNQPASIIVSKDVFFKRAIENPNFNGMKSGIIVSGKDGNIIKKEGHIYTKNEEILGAWCEVFRKDWEHSIYQEVNMDEYAGRKKTGELNSNWETRPVVMITKVAEATALRKAFTKELQGMYLSEENDNIEIPREEPVDLL